MAINWARGLDELGTGLLRQADIGNKAYEGAMAKEAETRAANRAFAAEERAAKRDYEKEIRAAKARESEFGRSLEHDLTLQELGHGFSIEELEKRAELQEQSDIKQHGRQAAHELKVWRMNRYAAVRDAKDAATTAKDKLKIDVNLRQAESADKKVTATLKLWLKAIEDGDTPKTDALALELSNAELQSREAWRKAGADPLITKQISEMKEFEVIGGEIVQAISLDTGLGEKMFREAITAIKQGKGSSGYDAAYESVSRTIDRIIEENPTFKNYRGPKKRRLKKQIIENLLPNVQLGEAAAGGDTATDEGNGVLAPSFWGGKPLDNIATDITEEDIGTVKKAQDILDARPARPGRVKSQEQKDLEKAQKRDPEYLIIHLNEEKIRIEEQLALPIYNPPKVQERLDKINELIKKFEAMLGNQQAAVPSPASYTSSGTSKVSMAQPRGMVNPRGGMIFEADRMPMDAASVDARYTA